MSEQPATKIYRMYYTYCDDPGCGAINDYADTRRDAERNRRAHLASHARADNKTLCQAEGTNADT